MKTRTCNLLTIALTSALLSPLAFGQSVEGSLDATAQTQEAPRPTLPPAANQPRPLANDPRMPPTDAADPQALEEPMTSPPPQGTARATGQATATQSMAWAELDADGDGRVSSAEGSIDADFTSQFSMIDTDGDGFVTDAEYRAHAETMKDDTGTDDGNPPPPPPSAQGAANAAAHSSVAQRDVWAQLDTDGDGRISSVEGSVDAGFTAGFAMADADADGFVSDAEYRAHAKAMHHDGATPPPTTAQGSANAAGHSAVAQRSAWAGLDANGDGRISVEEGSADADFSADFAMTDADADGFVSDAEYRAHAKAMQHDTSGDADGKKHDASDDHDHTDGIEDKGDTAELDASDDRDE